MVGWFLFTCSWSNSNVSQPGFKQKKVFPLSFHDAAISAIRIFFTRKIVFLLTTRPREAIVKRDGKKFTVFCSVAARTKKSYRNKKIICFKRHSLFFSFLYDAPNNLSWKCRISKIMQNEQTVASGQNRVKLGNLSLHFLNHPYVLTTNVAVTTKKKPSEQS